MQDDPNIMAARAAYQRGDYATVVRLLAPLADLYADNEPALVLLVNAALLNRSDTAAIPPLHRLIALRPGKPDYRRILSQALARHGHALRRAGKSVEAEQSFESACNTWSDNDDARFNLAVLLGLRRAYRQALSHWRTLVERKPGDPNVQIEFADCLAMNDRPEQARALLSDLPAMERLDAPLRLRLAQAWADADDTDNARTALTGLDPKPEQARRLMDLADALSHASDIPAAQRAYRLAAQACNDGKRSPGLRAELGCRLALPAVYANDADLHAHRARYGTNVAELPSEFPPEKLAGFELDLSQLARTNFFLAYQGGDDRDLQSAYGRWLGSSAPVFAPKIAGLPTGSEQGRARIGLVGSIFRYCTAGSYFASWVRLLSEQGYEVHVFQLGPAFDDFTEALAKPAARLHRITARLDAFARTLFDAKCDLLIYPEIGMEARVLPLAALRLAPRQVCAWGHPVTTGLPTMDGYFTCAEMEPADAASHYSEPLLLLPGIGTEYAQPPLPGPVSRAELGLPEGRRLYLFPHALYKLHPDNDKVMTAIAAHDPDSVLVMFCSEARAALAPFRRRVDAAFRQAGLDPERHLCVLPMSSRERFLQIVRTCDVMVDSLHWSGGNTSLDALLCGLPLVTCPGKYMRSRQSAAMLRRMGMDELIVGTPDELVRLSVEIANSTEHRQHVCQRIRKCLPDLFDATGLGVALRDHVERLLTR
jgi:CRISPR-associated protein Csy1